METVRGSNLKASTLPDGGACSETRGEGPLLMDAFKAFIAPIVRAYLSGRERPDHNPTSLGNGDGHMLSALKNFVGRVVEEEMEHLEKNEPKNNIEKEDSITVKSMTARAEVPTPPTLAQWEVAYDIAAEVYNVPRDTVESTSMNILEKIRDLVFNRYPIRFLWFAEPESIMLVGRGDVYSIMQSQFLCRLSDTETNIPLQDAIRFGSEYVLQYCKQLFGYAILSHTWLPGSPGEITYKAWVDGSFDRQAEGYQKLAKFCHVARTNHDLQFGWMDTVCINKDSSSELDESIRSMYKWYQNSAICITYLADTSTVAGIHSDRWFTRGWTLQELLAPRVIFFYDSNWGRFTDSKNDRTDNSILVQVEQGSSVTPRELCGFPEHNPPISRKMQWAAGRNVTREEDTSYSLMGLFNVSMSTAYGEGAERAFARLVKKIIANPGWDTVTMDIINCGRQGFKTTVRPVSSILPRSPGAFTESAPAGDIWRMNFRQSVPMVLTPLGLHVSALVIRGMDAKPPNLPTWTGQYSAWGQVRVPCQWAVKTPPSSLTYSLLRRPFVSDKFVEGALFAIVNHMVNGDSVVLGKECLAIIASHSTVQSSLELKIPVDGGKAFYNPFRSGPPIQFRLHDCDTGRTLLSIPIADLESNGLYLRTLYM